MNRWLFFSLMLVGAVMLAEFDRAMMVFQIREALGFDPYVAMHIGTVSGLLSQILIAVTIATAIYPYLSDNDE